MDEDEETPTSGRSDVGLPGVRLLDHTADVGLEIEADDPAELLRRAAAGMMRLLLERRPEARDEVRELRIRSEDMAGLLRDALRELLFWHEAEGFVAAELEVRRLDPGGDGGAALEAAVRGGADPSDPVREIKGVTLHGLVAEPRNGGWFGRVVFDV